MSALLNGRPCASALPNNRATAYGDGVFETLRVDANGVLWIDEHLQRLAQGAARLGLWIDIPALHREIAEILVDIVGPTVLKIQCYRRAGGRGYFGAEREAERLLSLWPLPGNTCWAKGARLMLCQTRLAENPALAGIKHCNRLEQVLAAAELARSGCDEGLMLDGSGCLVEGTRSNLFVVKDGTLMTPSLARSGVAGIMRKKIIEWASGHGVDCREGRLGPSALPKADEVFVCNSVFGIWPVTAVGCVSLPVGELCRTLQREFDSQFHA